METITTILANVDEFTAIFAAITFVAFCFAVKHTGDTIIKMSKGE
jgi:hypothetical protein